MKSQNSKSGTAGRTLFATVGLLAVVGAVVLALSLTRGRSQMPPSGPTRLAGPWFFDQPIVAADVNTASSQEALALRVAVASGSPRNTSEIADLLESFVTENPGSVWSPSLRANLARFYYREGRYSKALGHWEQAWEDTKAYPSGAGKHIADDVLAHWTRVLVRLGRAEQLSVIFEETQGRLLDGGPLQQQFLRTREMYAFLRHSGSASYKCGWLVLSQLAADTLGRWLDPRNAEALYQDGNLLNSCSMKGLRDLAGREQWSLTGVARPQGTLDLPVPALAHLLQGHYIALLRQEAGLVVAYDPLFGVRHFRREDLNEEVSGRFLVPTAAIPAGWRALTSGELETTVGRSGWFAGYPDPVECVCESCQQCPPGLGGGPGATGGNPGHRNPPPIRVLAEARWPDRIYTASRAKNSTPTAGSIITCIGSMIRRRRGG